MKRLFVGNDMRGVKRQLRPIGPAFFCSGCFMPGKIEYKALKGSEGKISGPFDVQYIGGFDEWICIDNTICSHYNL